VFRFRQAAEPLIGPLYTRRWSIKVSFHECRAHLGLRGSSASGSCCGLKYLQSRPGCRHHRISRQDGRITSATQSEVRCEEARWQKEPLDNTEQVGSRPLQAVPRRAEKPAPCLFRGSKSREQGAADIRFPRTYSRPAGSSTKLGPGICPSSRSLLVTAASWTSNQSNIRSRSISAGLSPIER